MCAATAAHEDRQHRKGASDARHTHHNDSCQSIGNTGGRRGRETIELDFEPSSLPDDQVGAKLSSHGDPAAADAGSNDHAIQ